MKRFTKNRRGIFRLSLAALLLLSSHALCLENFAQPPDATRRDERGISLSTGTSKTQTPTQTAASGISLNFAFVEEKEQAKAPDRNSLQRPRVFYRRALETNPLILARPAGK